jgi:hypothetical protein
MVVSNALQKQKFADKLTPQNEALIARLSRAAYDVALRHAPNQPFTELELEIWRELRAVFQTEEEVRRLHE